MTPFTNTAIIFYFLFEFCLTAPPTLDDITRKKCPPDKPFKCLPYGLCYNADSYCQSGTVETCFPTLLPGSSPLKWCREQGQYNATLMRNKSACSLACQARFNSSQLSEDLQKLSQKVCPENQPHKCPGDSECYGSSDVCYNGKVKSCFPEGMDSIALLDWCRYKGQFDVSLMNNNGCTLACQAKFKCNDLLHVSDKSDTGIILFGITLAICIVQFTFLCLVRRSLCKVMWSTYRKWKFLLNLPCLEYQDKKEVAKDEMSEELHDNPPIKKDQAKTVSSHESQQGSSSLALLRRQNSTNQGTDTDNAKGILLRN